MARDQAAEGRLRAFIARQQAGEKLRIALRGVTGHRWDGQIVLPAMRRLENQGSGKGRKIHCAELEDDAVELGWGTPDVNQAQGGRRG